MRLALFQLPHFFGAGLSRQPDCYPLGLGYLSSVLTRKGVPHEGIDLWSRQLCPEAALQSADFRAFDAFGVSFYSTQYKYFKAFASGLKAAYPRTPIICGGPGPTFSSEVILRHTGADICVLGEGEAALPELLERLDRPESVRGIAFKRGGQVVRTAPRPQIRDLDSLPLPNRRLFDFSVYASTMKAAHGTWSADILAGRGCPYRCRYCSKTFSGLRLRSTAEILGEARLLKEEFAIDHLQFDDELVLVGKPRVLELCRGLKDLGLRWTCQGRINQVSRELLLAMKEAGCMEVGYGVESVSQDILDRMGKGIRAQDIVPVIELTRQIGIQPIIQYMYGYPGEDAASIRRTYEFFKRLDLPFMGSTTTPIPGTELYRDCLAKGLIKDEEAYLLALDAGYSEDHPLVNLTGFSDRELVRRKKLLRWRVNHRYYSRRPREYAAALARAVARRVRGWAGRLLPGAAPDPETRRPGDHA